MDIGLGLPSIWAQEPRGHAGPIGPAPVQAGGPPLLIGGNSAAAYRRVAEHGVGWISGGGGPEWSSPGADQARAAWRKAGRQGDELILFPCDPALAQVSMIADAALG